MTLIEGVGDEVTDFFIAVVVLLVGWLAWCSTSITDQPLIRTVLILQHRTRTRIAELRANHQNTSTFNQPPNLETSPEETTEQTPRNNDAASNCSESSAIDSSGGNLPESNRTPEAAATEEVLIEAMDSFNSDNSSLLQRQAKVDASDSASTTPPTHTDNSEHATENLSANNANEISIKLKFINDDQKVVTGSLKELLGDFKKRHFQLELEAQKLVRLVFKGKILQPDSQTLETCGLYNNCVVHCLVHQPRPAPISQQSNAMDNSSIYFDPQTFSDMTTFRDTTATAVRIVRNEWDMGRLTASIFTLILGLAWYSRYHYAQFYTATTTLALYTLTVIYSVSLFGNWFFYEVTRNFA